MLGVTQANVDQMKASTKDPEMRRYLGLEGDFGKLLGVDNEWAYRIAKDIGNYGELYDAYFGSKGLGTAAWHEQPVLQRRAVPDAQLEVIR